MTRQDALCYPRKQFKTKEAAQAACVSIAERRQQHRMPVPCSHCNCWHLSVTKPTNTSSTSGDFSRKRFI